MAGAPRAAASAKIRRRRGRVGVKPARPGRSVSGAPDVVARAVEWCGRRTMFAFFLVADLTCEAGRAQRVADWSKTVECVKEQHITVT